MLRVHQLNERIIVINNVKRDVRQKISDAKPHF